MTPVDRLARCFCFLTRQLHAYVPKASKDGGDDILPTANSRCMASKAEPGERQEGKVRCLLR